MVEIAKEYDVKLCHENEKLIYGDTLERVNEIARTLGGANITEITKENAKQLLLQKNDLRG